MRMLNAHHYLLQTSGFAVLDKDIVCTCKRGHGMVGPLSSHKNRHRQRLLPVFKRMFGQYNVGFNTQCIDRQQRPVLVDLKVAVTGVFGFLSGMFCHQNAQFD